MNIKLSRLQLEIRLKGSTTSLKLKVLIFEVYLKVSTHWKPLWMNVSL